MARQTPETRDDEKYAALLEEKLASKAADFGDLVSGLWGLDGLIKKRERPYADQNAQADIEGRPRPVRSYGGVDRGHVQFWRALDPKSKQR